MEIASPMSQVCQQSGATFGTCRSPADGIWLDLSHIPANLLSLGALDFGMVVDGAVVMVENIVRHISKKKNGNGSGTSKTTAEVIREAAHEVQRPVFYAIAIIITAYLPIFTLQRVEGRLFRPMACDCGMGPRGRKFRILNGPINGVSDAFWDMQDVWYTEDSHPQSSHAGGPLQLLSKGRAPPN